MRYKFVLTLTVLLSAMMAATVCGQSKRSQDLDAGAANAATEQEIQIQFSTPMAPAEVLALAKRTRIRPKELLYQFPGEQGDVISGGYVLDASQGLESAL